MGKKAHGERVCAQDVFWTYEGAAVPTLRGASLTVEAGECVVLTGPSGCGKTTFSRVLNGLAPHFYEGAFSGSVFVGGLSVPQAKPHEIARSVGSVFQDPRAQFFATTVEDEVAFGCENLALPAEETQARMDWAISAIGADDVRGRDLFGLSSGQKQKVAIASAVAMDPPVLVFDEPSANLDNESAAMLAQVLARLKALGRTIVVAEHRLHYLMDVADRVVVMEEGRMTGWMTPREALSMGHAQAVARGLRMACYAAVPFQDAARPSAAGSEPASHAEAASHVARALEPPAVEARGLSVSHRRSPVLDGLTFSVAGAGSVVGIVGANGAGKTTLVRTLCGLKAEDAGDVRFDGETLKPKRRRERVAFVMQDADYQLFTESVEAELRFARPRTPDLERGIGAVLGDLGLQALRGAHHMTLSGGQKQRLTIACALTSDARAVFFDEPTSGLDGASMRSVARLLRGMARNGRRVFVITHDFEFVACACDEVFVVAGGRMADRIPVAEASRSRLMAALGLR